ARPIAARPAAPTALAVRPISSEPNPFSGTSISARAVTSTLPRPTLTIRNGTITGARSTEMNLCASPFLKLPHRLQQRHEFAYSIVAAIDSGIKPSPQLVAPVLPPASGKSAFRGSRFWLQVGLRGRDSNSQPTG